MLDLLEDFLPDTSVTDHSVAELHHFYAAPAPAATFL
jgi:hypothetical protein